MSLHGINLREGIKRIYLIFSFCVLAVPVASYWDEFPTKDRINQETLWKLDSEIAPQIGVQSWEVPELEGPADQFIDKYCSGKLVFTKAGQPDITISKNALVCDIHKEKKDFYLVEQAKWVGMVALVTALTAMGLAAAFLLARWVLNGFFPKK